MTTAFTWTSLKVSPSSPIRGATLPTPSVVRLEVVSVVSVGWRRRDIIKRLIIATAGKEIGMEWCMMRRSYGKDMMLRGSTVRRKEREAGAVAHKREGETMTRGMIVEIEAMEMGEVEGIGIDLTIVIATADGIGGTIDGDESVCRKTVLLKGGQAGVYRFPWLLRLQKTFCFQKLT